MRLEHTQICTWNSEVEVGKTYLYTEGNLECKVKVVQTKEQREGIQLNLKVMAKPQSSPLHLGEEFEVVASWPPFAKASWWYLHDPELVHF